MLPIVCLFFLYHKPLAPVGFIEAGWTCLLPVIWRRFFIVTPRMFTFSFEYVENEERLIAAKASNAYKHCKSGLRIV